jgi:hypothetical protein
MFFPLVAADISEVIAARFDWGDAIPAGRALKFVVIALIVIELVFQIIRSPEKGLIP